MPRERTISCSDCPEWKRDLELRGFAVHSCKPIPGTPGFCLLVFDEATPTARPRAIRRLAGVKGVGGKLEMSRSRAIPRRVFDLSTPPSKGPPRRIARRFLRRVAPQLGIAPDLSDLKFERVKESLLGRHALFQQYLGRTPISGAWIRVDIDKDGRVYNVQNDLVPQKALARVASQPGAKRGGARGRALDERTIRDEARAGVTGGTREVLSSELLYRPTDGLPRLSWKVVVHTTDPSAEWKMYFDAVTGQLLWKRNVLKKATGRARVFDPHPVATLNDITLTDRTRIPDSAYSIVELQRLRSSGYLDGAYVSTAHTRNRVRRRDRKFLFSRGEVGFKEAMVYFHIDRVQRHLQALGFANLLDQPIRVNVTGQRADNSFYSPGTKSLSFGTGGVDDAEDAEIILHEYGHAVQDDQVPGFGESDEGAAMGEGFGDFLAASFFGDSKPARLRPTIGSWDAVPYSAEEPPCLRRLDSNKKYPKDLRGEEHDDGEIWSACLWELRVALGREVAERLVVAHHYLLNRWAGFEDAANALVTTDLQVYGGRNADAIRDVFIRRGILPNPKRRGRRAGARFNQ